MPAFSYTARTRPAGVVPLYEPAFFASFPLTRLVVVAGPTAPQIKRRLEESSLPTAIVQE